MKIKKPLKQENGELAELIIPEMMEVEQDTERRKYSTANNKI